MRALCICQVYDDNLQGMKRISTSSTVTTAKHGAVCAMNDAFPCVLLLRHTVVAASSQPPLIIAHSLLGDHKGYGRLWSLALPQMAVYALRHQCLLDDCSSFSLDGDGAMNMVAAYASVIGAMVARKPFDLMGASFGAVLASHVACAFRAVGGCPRRLVLIDPPPAVSSKLLVPKMLTRHVSEPCRHVSEPCRHVSEPCRHMSEVSEPCRHVSEPCRHVSEPCDSCPGAKLVPSVAISFCCLMILIHVCMSNHVTCAQPSNGSHGRVAATSADRDGGERVGKLPTAAEAARKCVTLLRLCAVFACRRACERASQLGRSLSPAVGHLS